MLINKDKIEFIRDPKGKGRDYQYYEVKDGKKIVRRLFMKEYKNNREFMKYVKENKYVYGGDEPLWTYGSYRTRAKTHEVATRGDVSNKIVDLVRELRTEIEFESPELFSGRGKSMKRKRRYRDDGDELDIDRVMSGVPEYWIKTERGVQQKAITLGLNASMSHKNGEKEFAQLTAMAIVLSDVLTTRGVATRIMYCSSGWNELRGLSTHETSVNFTLKDFEEPLDQRRIGLIYAQGIFRDSIFALFRRGFYGHTNAMGFGNSMATSEEMMEFMGIDYIVENSWGGGSMSEYAQNFVTQIMEGC